MVTTFCISGGALAKAGKNVDGDLSGGMLKIGADIIVDHWINRAEATIIDVARYNFITNYGSLNINTKLLIDDICSSLTAIECIKYNMDAYTSRIEAEDMVNVERDAALRGLSIIKDKKTQDFINAA